MIRTLLAVLGLAAAWPVLAQNLAEALPQALARHPELTAVAAREAEARARAEVAAGLTPGPGSLSLDNRNDRLNRNRGKEEWELELAVPLWLPGQQAAREAAAEVGIATVAARREALRLEVAGTLREAWWGLAGARLGQDLARRRLATARALEADVMRRFKAGDLARVDANLAGNERLAAQAELLAAEAALLQAEQAYAAVTGAAPPATLAEEAGADAREPRADHPRLAAATTASQLARAQVRVAEETRREAPELALRLIRERDNFGESYANQVGVKLTIPFSSGARLRQETSGALAGAAQADAELALARQRLDLDVRQARLDLEAAERQLAMARERRELTADNLRLGEKAFALGESDLATLLRLRAAAFEAESLLGRQQVARAAAGSHLKQVLGVLP